MQAMKHIIINILRRVQNNGLSDFVVSDRSQIGEYGIVYNADSRPGDPSAVAVAVGSIRSLDLIGVVIEPLKGTNLSGQYVRVPWARVGFIWSMPMAIAINVIEAGDQPRYVN